MSAVIAAPCDQIRPGNNDRKDFDRAELERLAASIEVDGLLQPITLREVVTLEGSWYEVVAGERRFRAVTEVLGWATIDAIVRALDDDAASRAMAVENLVRVDLDPIAEAEAYHGRMERHSLDVAGCAKWCGVTKARVTARLELLGLCPEMRELVRVGQLPLGHARLAARLSADFQVLAVRAYGERDLSYLAFRAFCDELEARSQSVGMFDADEFWTLADDCAAKTKKVAPVLAANDLMDTGEVAAMLGTTAHKLKDMRARIERYRKLDGMPEPLRLVGGRPVWLRADIDRWLAGEGKPAVRYCPACSHLEASHVRRDGARFCTAEGGCACFKREAS